MHSAYHFRWKGTGSSPGIRMLTLQYHNIQRLKKEKLSNKKNKACSVILKVGKGDLNQK
jgi:hypothetical protein